MTMENLRYHLHRLRGIRLEKLRTCVRKCAGRSGRSRISIFADMCLCYLLFGAVYTDYLLFGFDMLPLRAKKDYLTRTRLHKLLLWANPPAACEVVGSKYRFYQQYHEYMGRRMIRCDAAEAELDGFLAENPRFFLKPDGGTGGEGVHEVRREDYGSNAELKAYLRSCKDCVLEQVITQHPLLARFNPDSVNTLRIVRLCTGAEPELVFCALQIGRRGRRVDNLCAGGMVCAVDTRRGCVCSDAFDNDGDRWPTHPDDADTVFNGMTVPCLAEALALSSAAAQRLYREAGLRLVGFDIAVTPEGPILSEANPYPTHYSWQRPGFADGQIPTGLWKLLKDKMADTDAAAREGRGKQHV